MRVLSLFAALAIGCSGELRVDAVRDAAARPDLSGDLAGQVQEDLALADLTGGSQDIAISNDLTWTNVRNRILVPRCSTPGCHGNLKTPMNLTDLATLRNIQSDSNSNRRRVDVFSPESSMLYLKVTGTLLMGEGEQMPKGGPPLAQADANFIAAWIKAGANDN